MKWILLIFLQTFLFSFWGQNSIQIRDCQTQLNLTDGFITCSREGEIVGAFKPDSNGNILLDQLPNGLYRLQVTVKDYYPVSKDLYLPLARNENLCLTKTEYKTLAPVSVSADSKKDTIFSSQNHQVDFFEFFSSDSILIFSHVPFKVRAAQISVLCKGRLSHTINWDDRIEETFTDYMGGIYFYSNSDWFSVVNAPEYLKISKVNSDLMNQLKRTCTELNGIRFMSNYIYHYPEVTWYTLKDSIEESLQIVKDPLMMELYRSEYKYVDVRTKIWAEIKEIETGIDAEIWVGASVFTHSLYYQPVYAPAFSTGKKIVVFDLYKNEISMYNDRALLDQSRPLKLDIFDKKTGFQMIIQDVKNLEIYALHEKSGKFVLSFFDIDEAAFTTNYEIKEKYVKEMKVYNGNVYYLHRPLESVQTYYLYKERLPNFDSKTIKMEDQNIQASGR